MKRIWILIAGVFMLTQLSARDVININRDWRFFSHTEGSSDRAQGVNLPHMWNNDALSGRNDYFRGVGNYMKDIAVPKEWAGRRIFVRFGGAGTVADLIGAMSANTGAVTAHSRSI